ncbi:hypothetical protein PIB30_060422 [Stylosanthes scabra]|uniref:Uncharacterized protein n=1 Tax=Stylosanthes scabra TaxID=79078 RepID=A0ABU6SLE6_9FABA|nr:hypothetical protein [Stylosanthes scabra]
MTNPPLIGDLSKGLPLASGLLHAQGMIRNPDTCLSGLEKKGAYTGRSGKKFATAKEMVDWDLKTSIPKIKLTLPNKHGEWQKIQRLSGLRKGNNRASQCELSPTEVTVSTFGTWFLSYVRKIRTHMSSEQDVLVNRIAYLCWEIWKSRNWGFHQKTEANPKVTIIRAKQLEEQFRLANQDDQHKLNNTLKRKVRAATWKLPPGEWVKANVDDAYNPSTGNAGTGRYNSFKDLVHST